MDRRGEQERRNREVDRKGEQGKGRIEQKSREGRLGKQVEEARIGERVEG